MKTRVLIAALLAVATSSFAQSTTDQLKTLQPVVGSWKCTGKAFASEMGPEHATQAAVTGKWVLNARWLEIRYNEDKNSRNPNPFSIVAYWTYDEGTKKFVAATVDSMGGYSMEDSTGWSGDQLVFAGTGHMGPMTMQGRDTFNRKGTNELSHSFEVQDAAGGWKKLDEETCKRQ